MKMKFIFPAISCIVLIFSSVDAQNPNWTVLYVGYNVHDIAFDNNGNHWLATNNMGLWNISTGEYFRPDNSSMPDIRINAFHVDMNGKIWCATHDNGLVSFNGSEFNNYKVNPVADSRWDRFYSVCMDNNGIVWCGAEDVYSFNGTEFTKHDYNNSPLDIFADQHSIFKDKDGKLWIAGTALFGLENGEWSALYNQYGSFTSAAFDSKGNIWGGLWGGNNLEGGLSFYDNSDWLRYHPSDSPIPSNRVKTLVIDKFDQVWIGTFDKGVAVFNGHSWAVYNTGNSQLSNDKINRIVIGPDDKIYICTASGLNIVDGGIILDVNTEQLPMDITLNQNYPNPFNPSTVISYQLPAAGHVALKVYDLLGKEVATLVNEQKAPGKYEVKFDGSSAGGGLASGVYFYKLQSGSFIQTKKFMLVK